jgi:hypothetical protein
MDSLSVKQPVLFNERTAEAAVLLMAECCS